MKIKVFVPVENDFWDSKKAIRDVLKKDFVLDKVVSQKSRGFAKGTDVVVEVHKRKKPPAHRHTFVVSGKRTKKGLPYRCSTCGEERFWGRRPGKFGYDWLKVRRKAERL